MSNEFAENLLGKILEGKYRLDTVLGIGGMSVVFKAYDTSLDRIVAVKVLSPEFYSNASFKERFLREARTAAKLTHPNIITIHTVGEYENNIYFVMDYIEGNTLSSILKQKKKFKFNEAIYLIKSIVEALDYAHSNGVIHRDIKPGNIMVTKDNRVIVMDFGIAKLQTADKLTKTGMTIGTAEYMSPEQVRGEDIDYRSDYYSLGVVIYELLTGELPFKANDAYSMGIKHLTETPIEPIKVNPDIPEYVNKSIMKLLSKKQGDRFQTANEILDGFNIKHKETTTTKILSLPNKVKSKPEKKSKLKIVIIILITVFLFYYSILYTKNYLMKKSFTNTGKIVLITVSNSMREYIFPVLKPVELSVNLEPIQKEKFVSFIGFINKDKQLVVFTGSKELRKYYLLNVFSKVIQNKNEIYVNEIKFNDKKIIIFSKQIQFRALNKIYNTGYMSIGIYLDEVLK